MYVPYTVALTSGLLPCTPMSSNQNEQVNTAARMETNSLPLCIHLSPSAAALLAQKGDEFVIAPRGTINVKGT